MFGEKARIRDRLDRLETTVEEVGGLVRRIEAALVVRDPGTARSIEAYEGLRKAVVSASAERRRMCVQLVEMHDRMAAGTSTSDMESLVEEWLIQAGIRRLDEGTPLEAFEVLGGEGEDIKVVKPAWVDAQTGALLRLGAIERIHGEPVTPEAASVLEPETDAPTEATAPDEHEAGDQQDPLDESPQPADPDPLDADAKDAASSEVAPKDPTAQNLATTQEDAS